MQHDMLVSYDSRRLKEHEKKYPVHDLELAAIIFGLKISRHYMYDITLRFSLTIRVSNICLLGRNLISDGGDGWSS